jgi:C_GCAxxG_C_C family probable redox protein
VFRICAVSWSRIGVCAEGIPKIATGFASGIGRKGSICGALAGAIMAIGLRYGRNAVEDREAYELCIARSRRYVEEAARILMAMMEG